MGKTNIEYCDEVSNPLQALDTETGKMGTFCEKPDPEGTCKNCWAETLNLKGTASNKRFGNGLIYDKSNRGRIEWQIHVRELIRLGNLNRRKPMSAKFPGVPLVVFTNDTYDLFQPSISDQIRDWIFDDYDKFTNLTLLIQTTYVSRMSTYLSARYPNGMPKQYFVGMSAGTQKFLDDNIQHLVRVRDVRRYIIFEPLLEEIDVATWLWSMMDGGKCAISLCIAGGESGGGARVCDIEWLRSIVRQCQAAGVSVLCKQLGAKPIDGSRMSFDHDKLPIKTKDRKGGNMAEFPQELQIREFPKV